MRGQMENPSFEMDNVTPCLNEAVTVESETEDRLPELSIVMPCLNEAETVESCIGRALRFLEREEISGEIVIADNGSTDGSPRLAAEAGARVVHVAQKGYGNALRGGIVAARGKFIIMGDADCSYDFLNLRSFIEKLRGGFDLVMGNRFQGGIEPGAMPFLHKYLGNPVLSRIGRLFFKADCKDFHCGLRGFSKDAFLRMDLQTTGMEFASEIVVKASLLGMRITEVPTTLSVDGRSRAPHLRSWRDGWRHLRFLLLLSPTWLFLAPGLFLFLLGTLFGSILTWTPLKIADVVFDANTLLICSMSQLIGFQLTIFGLFAKALAVQQELIPEQKYLKKFLVMANLERGLIAGLTVFLSGLALLFYRRVQTARARFRPARIFGQPQDHHSGSDPAHAWPPDHVLQFFPQYSGAEETVNRPSRGCFPESQPSAGCERATPPEQNRGMTIFVLALLCIKLVLYLADPMPKFFLGDSAWYILSAYENVIPPDRSFVYGYLIRLFSLGSKSLAPLVLSQILAGTASAVLLAYALRRYFSVKPGLAYLMGILCGLEPIQLLYERYVMTESFSLLCLALYMTAGFRHLSGRRLGSLCSMQVFGTALIALRISFLPLVLVNTVFLPLLAFFGQSRSKRGGESDSNPNGIDGERPENPHRRSGWRHLPRPVLHVLVSVCLAGVLHTGYKLAFSRLSGNPPGYNAASGYFLLSIWAPAVEPGDFPYPELRARVFSNLSYDLKDRFKRNEQLFAGGGLVDGIRQAVPGPEGNRAAMQTALNALKRSPSAVVMLSLATLGDYFNPHILREKMANDLAMDDDQVELYRECRKICGRYIDFPARAGPRQPMTLTGYYYKYALPWYWFLILTPLSCIPALLRTKNHPARAMMIEVSLAICVCVAVACFMTPFPVVRYLHPVSWLVFFPLSVLISGFSSTPRR